MRRLALTLALALWPALAAADVAPQGTADAGAGGYLANGCQKVTLCNAQSGTGDCTRAGDEIVWRLAGQYTLTLYHVQSTATSYTFTLESNDQGHDAASGASDSVSSAVSETDGPVSLTGLFDYVWINLSAVAGGNVTVTALACPLGVR